MSDKVHLMFCNSILLAFVALAIGFLAVVFFMDAVEARNYDIKIGRTK